MRVRFIGSGAPDENAVCKVFGLSFPMDEWTEVPADVGQRLATNWTFEVDADENGEADPSTEDLRAQLDGLGVKYHPRTGHAKLLALLADHKEGGGE